MRRNPCQPPRGRTTTARERQEAERSRDKLISGRQHRPPDYVTAAEPQTQVGRPSNPVKKCPVLRMRTDRGRHRSADPRPGACSSRPGCQLAAPESTPPCLSRTVFQNCNTVRRASTRAGGKKNRPRRAHAAAPSAHTSRRPHRLPPWRRDGRRRCRPPPGPRCRSQPHRPRKPDVTIKTQEKLKTSYFATE